MAWRSMRSMRPRRPGPGRKLARTRQARRPSRRSRLAGWIWSFSDTGSASGERAGPDRLPQELRGQDAGGPHSRKVSACVKPRNEIWRATCRPSTMVKASTPFRCCLNAAVITSSMRMFASHPALTQNKSGGLRTAFSSPSTQIVIPARQVDPERHRQRRQQRLAGAGPPDRDRGRRLFGARREQALENKALFRRVRPVLGRLEAAFRPVAGLLARNDLGGSGLRGGGQNEQDQGSEEHGAGTLEEQAGCGRLFSTAGAGLARAAARRPRCRAPGEWV